MSVESLIKIALEFTVVIINIILHDTDSSVQAMCHF